MFRDFSRHILPRKTPASAAGWLLVLAAPLMLLCLLGGYSLMTHHAAEPPTQHASVVMHEAETQQSSAAVAPSHGVVDCPSSLSHDTPGGVAALCATFLLAVVGMVFLRYLPVALRVRFFSQLNLRLPTQSFPAHLRPSLTALSISRT